MKRYLVILIIVVLAVAGGFWYNVFRRNLEQPSSHLTDTNMQITSPAFGNNQTIPAKYTCDGENINPLLGFEDVSDQAKSLALIVDDPDAPMGTWVHWIVWNIDPRLSQIAENSVPEGATQGQTSFGKAGYGGPCPPSGTHRYFFKLYALDIMLPLDSAATKQDLEQAMQNHILAQAELVGLYKL